MSLVFVTGTDTGIGKTFVSAALAAGFVRRGTSVGVVKAAETGCATVGGVLEAADALTLASAAADPSPLDELCPHRFPDALAPALAAERAGTAIDVAALAVRIRQRAATLEVLLVEGAGGLLVPLTREASFADLAEALDAHVLLVVGSRLGAINHALLTLEVATRRGLTVAGYVMNRLGPEDDLAIATNDELLQSLTRVPCLGTVPFTPDAATVLAALRTNGTSAEAARERLADLGTALDLATLTLAGSPASIRAALP